MKSIAVLLLAVLAGLTNANAQAKDWPQFRGPDGQGHSAEPDVPMEWSESQNVAWKTAVPGLGWSSPVICGGQLWLTTAVEDQGSLRALCFDVRTGAQLHDVEVFRKADLGPINPKNSHASPTPVCDGGRIYVHFGAHGTACLTTRGQVVWRNESLTHDHRHGPAGSPVIWHDLLILNCDGADQQFVVALDKQTGRIRWRAARGDKMAYATPLVISAGGVEQVVSPGGGEVTSFDPATGAVIWRFRHGGDSAVLRPVATDSMVYVTSGYGSTALYAFATSAQGDISATDAAWSLRRGVPYDPSPLIVGDELFLVSDQGVVSCVDARSGKQHWQQRLPGAYSASPLAAGGRIYLTNEEGVTTVLAAGKTMRKLATNVVAGRTLASLATADQAMFLRTDQAIYRIDSRGVAAPQRTPVAARSATPAR